jgi:hypothetical protein
MKHLILDFKEILVDNQSEDEGYLEAQQSPCLKLENIIKKRRFRPLIK